MKKILVLIFLFCILSAIGLADSETLTPTIIIEDSSPHGGSSSYTYDSYVPKTNDSITGQEIAENISAQENITEETSKNPNEKEIVPLETWIITTLLVTGILVLVSIRKRR